MAGGAFAALSLFGRPVLKRRIEPDGGDPRPGSGVPKRQAGGFRGGVRIVSTVDNIDNWTPTPFAADP
jgi:hypothetical protein